MARGTIIIPTPGTGAEPVVEDIEHHLARKFGGYSSYEGRGGWVADNGDLIREPHRRLVTSTEDRERLESILEKCAHYVMAELEEDAVFTEITESEVQIH